MDIFEKCYAPSLANELQEKGIYPYFHALQSRQDVEVIMEGKRRIMLGSFVVFRQIYLYLTYRWFGTLLPVALGYPVGWVMCSVVLFFYYRSGKWMKRSFVVQ